MPTETPAHPLQDPRPVSDAAQAERSAELTICAREAREIASRYPALGEFAETGRVAGLKRNALGDWVSYDTVAILRAMVSPPWSPETDRDRELKRVLAFCEAA